MIPFFWLTFGEQVVVKYLFSSSLTSMGMIIALSTIPDDQPPIIFV